jgi:acyl dehydratase
MKMQFRSSPSLWSIYPRVIAARKPALLRDGTTVPRIEAELPAVRIDASHLRAYRECCGAADAAVLPIAYPHVLASGLHLAVLSHAAFPVKLLGLVHVRSVIRQHCAQTADAGGVLLVAIEGHVETDRGQEFTLRTQWRAANGELTWEEDCIFLARRKGRAPAGRRSADSDWSAETEAQPIGVRTTSFQAPIGLGRSYGLLGGDLNPIHLSDLSARVFGFKAAIAHGMWSLARCASDLDATMLQNSCELAVNFKLPVFLPAWLLFEQWQQQDGAGFCLRDNAGTKPHLTGTLRPLR